MWYVIYHAKHPNFGCKCSALPDPEFPKDFETVAIVDCATLEHAFRATNHVDSDWTKGEAVIELEQQNPRSTSVGDVIVEFDPPYKCHRCLSAGWETFDMPQKGT
jgi:hypothetical protein